MMIRKVVSGGQSGVDTGGHMNIDGLSTREAIKAFST